jgi:uncharacterized phage protein (TIGR01671 family)
MSIREIKFRAWDEDGFMFTPTKITFGTFGNKDSVEVWRGDVFGTLGSSILALMQYTGLKDKNGKEIYEGDIVTADWPYAKRCSVIWDVSRCGFYCQPVEGDGILGRAAYDKGYKMNGAKMEVTGNIYENPELLKGAVNGT